MTFVTIIPARFTVQYDQSPIKKKTAMNHQEIMDHYFAMWQSSEHHDWHYRDMVYYALEQNPLHALAILTGKYNQQVENGGHMQYFENGYADGVGGYFADHETADMHDLMLSLMRDYGLDRAPETRDVFTIMKRFTTSDELDCPECGGNGYFESYDEEEDRTYEEDCCRCNSTGIVTETHIDSDLADELDDAYYAINNAFLGYLDAFFSDRTKEI